MNNEFYLYEIIEDYQNASSPEEQNAIFHSFCDALWENGSDRTLCTRAVRFRVRKDLLHTGPGQVFDRWSNLKYTGYHAKSPQTDWCSLIRQKINNLYTRYFDRQVVLDKEYLALLNTPKRLYFRWTAGDNADPEETSAAIQGALAQAEALKVRCQQQKMQLSWTDYQRLIEEILLRTMKNCRPQIANEPSAYSPMYDFMDEDHLYIRYFCRCLEGELLKWQKQYYGLNDHKKYRRCQDCQCLFELRSYNQKRCSRCQTLHNRKNRTQKQRLYRQAKAASL